jgi:hypothetical protein
VQEFFFCCITRLVSDHYLSCQCTILLCNLLTVTYKSRCPAFSSTNQASRQKWQIRVWLQLKYFLIFCNRRGRAIRCTTRPPYLQGRASVPTEQEAPWAPEPVCKVTNRKITSTSRRKPEIKERSTFYRKSKPNYPVFFFLRGEGLRRRCYGRTAALRLLVQPLWWRWTVFFTKFYN